MKKLISLLLGAALIFSLAACTETENTTNQPTQPPTSNTESNYDENQVPDDVSKPTDEVVEPTEPIAPVQKTLVDIDSQFEQIQATGEIVPESAPVYDYFFLDYLASFWTESTFAVIPTNTDTLGQLAAMLEQKTWGETKVLKLEDIKALNATLTNSGYGALITFTSSDKTKTVEEAVAAGEWAIVIIGMEDIKTTLGIDNTQSIAEAILTNFGQPTELEYATSEISDGITAYSMTCNYKLNGVSIQLQLTKYSDSVLNDYTCAVGIAPITSE